MKNKRKEIAKKVEDEDMKKWAIQISALEDMPLSEWEQGFIASISDWFITKGSRLSERQAETLEKIYRKHF